VIADLAPLVAVTGLVGVFSVFLRRRAGVARGTDDTLTAEEAAELALPEGRPAVLLFTAAGCAPCGPAKRVLEQTAARRGVDLITADVAEHPGLTAEHRIFRAPTALVLAAGGHAVARISGVPRTTEVDAALDQALASTPA